MDVKQAMDIIKVATSKIQATREDHQLILQAIQAIENALKPKEETPEVVAAKD